MLDYQEFVSKPKALLIAPAGYGKTFTIAESLKFTIGKQLILTHTHAGVSSIKEKLRRAGIPSTSFNVETITSFSQKYVLSFYTGKDIPEQAETKKYYPFIIEKAIELFKKKPIKDIISNTYSGLFVDEYQDCTFQQHELVLALSNIQPSRLLGDYLQGIFDFNKGSLVDLREAQMMGDFFIHQFQLKTPWRWENGINKQLGYDLSEIREKLINGESINLNHYKSIETVWSRDIYKYNQRQFRKLLAEEKSLLIIHPDSANIFPRIKFIQRFNNTCRLIESIDSKEFYSLSKKIDEITPQNALVVIRQVCSEIFTKTGIDFWFNESRIKRKSNEQHKVAIKPIEDQIKELEVVISFSTVANIIRAVKDLPQVKCYRKELFSNLCKALEDAESNNLSVYDSMVNNRNTIRRVGRKIYGKCIGTTLLTKGLEFDTVAIIDAHMFKCPKHLYVALSRASNRLIVFTNNQTLAPYN